ncbi:hypothetical protein KBB96_08250 [Luteolibacter ambystomatis]|uniref:Uncharacterized protein n=1 Tax=Luteolibacter ambystomatis TaxID=2824561 RepID=A0A975PH31_9BACT|nr:hypothetical protein [Luteolibacter ambystomatis]QUE52871.1 hypothetical protein KBB96_08250 [Luteolibacter ambystomatis]
MPLNGPASFLPLADELLVHWAAVDAARGDGNPLLLVGRIGRSTLLELREKLEVTQAAVARARASRSLEAHDLEAQDKVVARRMNQFRQYLHGSGVDPKISPEEARVLWQKLETESGEAFCLPTEYTRLDFITDLSARRLMASALAKAEKALASSRGRRDEYQDQLHGFAEMYRDRVREFFPVDHELVKSLPVLTVPKGQAPAPVDADCSWEGDCARVWWTPSADPAVAHYDVRGMAGADYEMEDERLVGRVTAGSTCQVETISDLDEPEARASFRVYVVLRSGQEKGSRPVTVSRA